VYGVKFCGVSLAVAIVWSFMLLRESHERGFGGLMRDGLFQICLLSCAAILLLPTSIDVPGYTINLSFITERLTLPYGVLICAFLATCNPPRWQTRLLYPIAAVFFFLIYVDTSALNRTEQAMEEAVKDLTLNDRVVSPFIDPLSRVQLWTHHVDRICLGKCISYANYEPFTRAFRVQPTAAWSPLVLTTAGEVGAVSAGVYRVKPRDLPLYQVTLCGESQSICLKKLAPGEQVIKSQLSVLPLWW
jgi:hypothetical protein